MTEQDVLGGIDELSVQLVEKANFIMVEGCSIAMDLVSTPHHFEKVSTFSRGLLSQACH